MSRFRLSGKQADAILQMRLQTLTGLEQVKIKEEYAQLVKDIAGYKKILGSEKEVLAVIRAETIEIREKYADKRRTKISGEVSDICEEDLVPVEEVVVTLTNRGYVKRVPVDEYRMQKRGGKGITATGIGEDGFVKDMFIANSHDYLLFFSDRGRVHWLKAFHLPAASRYSMGKAIVNYLHMDEDEKISTAIPVKGFGEGKYLIFATRNGQVKKTAMEAYSRPRKGGIIAISLREGDRLIDVEVTEGKNKVFLATKNGYAIKFDERDVRQMGRTAAGVRGIRLRPKDEVIGMEVLTDGEQILTVSELGCGKRTEASYYKVQRRGGKGLINMKIREKNGPVRAIKKVTGQKGEQIMLISSHGTAIRVATAGISLIGRSTQGVWVMRLKKGDKLEEIALIEENDEEENAEENANSKNQG
jgi:DNA gyrase subunit A